MVCPRRDSELATAPLGLVSSVVEPEPVGRSLYFLVGAGAGAKIRLRFTAPAPPLIKQMKFSMITYPLVSSHIDKRLFKKQILLVLVRKKEHCFKKILMVESLFYRS